VGFRYYECSIWQTGFWQRQGGQTLLAVRMHFQEELNLTLAQSAWVQFAHYLGYFLMALPAGWLATKMGYKGGIIAGPTK